MATRAETELHWTSDPEANRLIASDGNALLIGFALDQQVPVPKAFSGPIELQKRLGYRPDGWEEALPNHPTLGDVDSAEALTTYQAEKRAYKAAKRAARSS
jgi:hypothetical protein